MNEPAFTPDITRLEGAKAGAGDLATLAFGEYKDGAMRVIAAGPSVVIRWQPSSQSSSYSSRWRSGHENGL